MASATLYFFGLAWLYDTFSIQYIHLEKCSVKYTTVIILHKHNIVNHFQSVETPGFASGCFKFTDSLTDDTGSSRGHCCIRLHPTVRAGGTREVAWLSATISVFVFSLCKTMALYSYTI